MCLPVAAFSDERILNYFSDIEVRTDGSLVITETIRVRSEGQRIQVGIYRDFPTRYRDRAGNRYNVDFQLLDVKRNGRVEDWHINEQSNGLRIYAGKGNRRIEPGVHEYRFQYQTSRQLGHFKERDELYWNVTGTGWDFAINQASARVRLPGAVPSSDLQVAVYTGAQGQTGNQARYRLNENGLLEFETTNGLAAREGLTIAVSWPAGLVERPGIGDRARFFFADNGGALAMLAGFVIMLGWYLWAWNRYGRDPRKGVIIPRFRPPEGLSAAACRYIMDMALGGKAFTAAVVSLGVKGWLTIEEQDKEFSLQRKTNAGGQTLSPGEQAVLKELLPQPGDSIEMENKNHAAFSRARAGLSAALAREYKNRLFRLNGWFVLPALAVTMVVTVIAAKLEAGPGAWISFIVATALLHLLFVWLLRAPTPGGRKIMDEIEGFKMYLNTAEQQRLDQMRSPAMTPEVFETFLPYAFALGVENRWAERFAKEFPQQLENGNHWQPGWYDSHLGSGRALSRIGSGLSSGLSSAISSASSPPGSSSGSGGGGFSGGGGGGGGGGGW